MVLRTALVVTALAGITFAARAEDRSVLLNCKAMVERASKDTGTATEAELTVPANVPEMAL